jgi:hypothetical protein
MAVDDTTRGENAAEYQAHRRSYIGFTKLLKWGGIAAAVVGYLVMLIISD